MLKQLHTSIVQPLVIIFNKSLTEGKFPDLMKLADIVPIHKAKEKYLTSNYRPISLLVTISKLLEKVMYKRTYNFLNHTDQLYQSQYGFRAQHSCENAVGELIGEIVKGQEHRKHTLAVFLDLSKAFDTLSHKILLTKLERYGIRGTSWKWFESYLDQRKLRVKCKTESGSVMNTLTTSILIMVHHRGLVLAHYYSLFSLMISISVLKMVTVYYLQMTPHCISLIQILTTSNGG